MRRNPVPGADLGIYVAAIPLLLRNPVIVVVPLLMMIVGVLIGQILSGPLGGFASLFEALLGMFGLGAACIMADQALRRGRVSFEDGWSDARRRAGDIFMSALGVTLLLTVAGYLGALLGPLALLVIAAAAVFLIWAVPATAIGGIPGGASIQVSVDRVRSTPVPAVVATVVSVLAIYLARLAAFNLTIVALPYAGASSFLAGAVISAVLQAIAISYVAFILTKTYSDSAFRPPRW
jgi:hypothetical protein